MPNKESQNYTVGFLKANLWALVAAGPFCVLFILGYGVIYGWSTLLIEIPIGIVMSGLLLVVFVAGVVIHEAIHAISWAWLDNISRKQIHFGFQWSTLTPYVHCSVPVTASSYRWGTVLPGIILGVLPCLAALIFQNIWMFYFGLLFTLAAGGDFLILWLIRNVESKALVQDHPEMIGCRVINPNE